MLSKISIKKTDNKAKDDNKKIDYIPFIQNNLNGYIKWE